MKRMHNHMGKMLPEIPDMDTQLALSAKMIDKRQATPKVFFPSILLLVWQHAIVDLYSFKTVVVIRSRWSDTYLLLSCNFCCVFGNEQ
jgi:hypothetical protein